MAKLPKKRKRATFTGLHTPHAGFQAPRDCVWPSIRPHIPSAFRPRRRRGGKAQLWKADLPRQPVPRLSRHAVFRVRALYPSKPPYRRKARAQALATRSFGKVSPLAGAAKKRPYECRRNTRQAALPHYGAAACPLLRTLRASRAEGGASLTPGAGFPASRKDRAHRTRHPAPARRKGFGTSLHIQASLPEALFFPLSFFSSPPPPRHTVCHMPNRGSYCPLPDFGQARATRCPRQP